MIPDHRLIYKFMKNLFTSAQLTSECAIVTLVMNILLVFLMNNDSKRFLNSVLSRSTWKESLLTLKSIYALQIGNVYY